MMKKIFVYFMVVAVMLSLTGCFAQAQVAKDDLHHVKTESDSTVAQNEEGSKSANSEIKAMSSENYNDLVTPKW